MMKKTKKVPPPLEEDRASILFAALDVAQARGDYARAAEIQWQLFNLGWNVTRHRPRLAAFLIAPRRVARKGRQGGEV